MRIQLDISIPMRDGVRLYGALYRPAAGERFPVLLIRSPYSTQHPRYVEWPRRFVAEGYAVLMQDSRGRYESGRPISSRAGTTICCTKVSSASRAGGNRLGGGEPASNRASWWGRGPIR